MAQDLGALTTTHPRPPLAWLRDDAKRATRRTSGTIASVVAFDNRHGFLGARFWGQVRGFSGRLRVLQDKGGTSGETRQIAGKARYEARFPDRIAGGDNLHGKEGVDGSSPSEGLQKSPANGHMVLPGATKSSVVAGTRRVRFGTGGHSRARATSRDTARNVPETLDPDHLLRKLLHTGDLRCPSWRTLTPSFAREGVITSQ